jgi:sporulation-control protein
MKKVLASIGIGNATVDTVLPTTTVTPGETVEAEIHVVGGSATQEVSAIDLELETKYATDDGYREATIDRLRLSEGLTVEPDQQETLTTDLQIPYRTPVTLGRADVWVETELEIDLAVDPEDKDYLDVQPTPRMQAVFDAAEELGLTFRSAELEGDQYGRYVDRGGFVQEFEFRPQGGPFAGDVDEIELVTVPGPDELTVYVEVDRRAGLLSELAETDERTTRFTISDADRATQALRETIAEHV